jgi:hypothetical protein
MPNNFKNAALIELWVANNRAANKGKVRFVLFWLFNLSHGYQLCETTLHLAGVVIVFNVVNPTYLLILFEESVHETLQVGQMPCTFSDPRWHRSKQRPLDHLRLLHT